MPMYINATTFQMEARKQEAAAPISISYIVLDYVGRGVYICFWHSATTWKPEHEKLGLLLVSWPWTSHCTSAKFISLSHLNSAADTNASWLIMFFEIWNPIGWKWNMIFKLRKCSVILTHLSYHDSASLTWE